MAKNGQKYTEMELLDAAVAAARQLAEFSNGPKKGHFVRIEVFTDNGHEFIGSSSCTVFYTGDTI